jgi:anaerobic selenocysteine-containing dehydrogenase
MIWRPTRVANSEPTVFKNVCPLDCPDTCSMRVTVQDGLAIDLKGDAEHVFSRGFLCQKMARYLPPDHAPFADGVFPTPSGKCELYSERMKADGLDPLPTYIPPREDPQNRPAQAAKYPLQLLSPPRPQFLNSTFANSSKHRAAAGEPTIELASFDAQARGLSDGQWAQVFNDRGSFQARVSLTGSVRPGVAVATGIYWNKLSPGGSNVNSTTSSALTDMGGGATFFDNLVEIQSLTATLDD